MFKELLSIVVAWRLPAGCLGLDCLPASVLVEQLPTLSLLPVVP